MVKFRFAVGRSKKNPQTGQWENDPNPLYIDCEAFSRPDPKRNLPDLITQYGKKGDPLYIEGRLQLDQWEDKNGGGKRSKHKIVVDNIEFLGGKDGDGDGGGEGGGGVACGRRSSGGGSRAGARSHPRRRGGDDVRRARRRRQPGGRWRRPHPVLGAGDRGSRAERFNDLPGGRHTGRPVHKHHGIRSWRRPRRRAKRAPARPRTKKLPQKKVRSGNQVKKGPHGGTLVVLVNDLAHVGKQGDMVEVKPGYARNYLLPYGMAVVPTDENLRTLEQYKIKVAEGPRGQGRGPEGAGRATVAGSRPSPSRPTPTEEGHLYGSIGPVEISKTLKGKNLMVEPDMVKLEHPIKEANTLTEVPPRSGYGIEAKIQVLVVALAQAARSNGDAASGSVFRLQSSRPTKPTQLLGWAFFPAGCGYTFDR